MEAHIKNRELCVKCFYNQVYCVLTKCSDCRICFDGKCYCMTTHIGEPCGEFIERETTKKKSPKRSANRSEL